MNPSEMKKLELPAADLVAIETKNLTKQYVNNTLRVSQAVELFEDHQDVASAILVLREAGRMCATSFIQTLRPGTLKIGALIAKDLVFGEGNLKAAAIEGSFEGAQESMEQWKLQQDSAFH